MYTNGTTVANRYLIEAIVAHGGMGMIYRAQDTRLHRIVALKVLRPDLAADPIACKRFLREGQIAAQMIHPNVVRTYDAGEDQAGPFLVQELLPGQTLDQIIPLSPQRAASIISDIASALQYIHSRGYLHCDIKPQNILLKQDGTPVLVDFGIARAEGAEATTLIATPHYLAPERAMGGPPTIAADLYALGIVLYQAIEGQVPFDAGSIPAIIEQHREVPVPPLRVAGTHTPILDRVIAALTAKDPAQRYDSAQRVRDDLEAIAHQAEHAYPTMPMGAPPAAALAAQPQDVHPVQQPYRRVAPPPPPPQPARTRQATWSTMPAWRKRRWIAGLLGALLALWLGFALVRGAQSNAQNIVAPSQPALIDPQPVSAEGENTQRTEPTAVEVPTEVPVQPTDVPVQPTEAPVDVQPAEPVQPAPPAAQPDTRNDNKGKDKPNKDKGPGQEHRSGDDDDDDDDD